MTLTITVLTPECVYQASDRRFTYPEGDGPDEPNEKNKAINWCNRIVFAFMGMAEIPVPGFIRQQTDLWLSECLGNIEGDLRAESPSVDQFELLRRLTEHLSAHFQENTVLDAWRRRGLDTRLAVVAAGWVQFSDASDIGPYRCLISNFHETRDSDISIVEQGGASERFNMISRRLQEGEAGLCEPFPRMMSVEQASRVVEALKGTLPLDFERMGIILVEAIRECHKFKTAVGRGVMMSALPKSAVLTNSGFFVAGPPSEDSPTFSYFPSQSYYREIYGPNFVCGGMAVQNFKVTPVDSDDDAEGKSDSP